jgi:hypothetical protein
MADYTYEFNDLFLYFVPHNHLISLVFSASDDAVFPCLSLSGIAPRASAFLAASFAFASAFAARREAFSASSLDLMVAFTLGINSSSAPLTNSESSSLIFFSASSAALVAAAFAFCALF